MLGVWSMNARLLFPSCLEYILLLPNLFTIKAQTIKYQHMFVGSMEIRQFQICDQITCLAINPFTECCLMVTNKCRYRNSAHLMRSCYVHPMQETQRFFFQGESEVGFFGVFFFPLFFLFAVPNVFPKMFPIAPHFYPICFAQSSPFFHLLVYPVHFAQVWTGYSTNLSFQNHFCNLMNFPMRKASQYLVFELKLRI